jgi:hypothetical protein
VRLGHRRRKLLLVVLAGLCAVSVLAVFTVRYVLVPSVTIQGRAVFKGIVPQKATYSVSTFPGVLTATDESLVVGEDGSLANVFVYVKEGAPQSPGPAAESVLVERRNCNFTPRVFGLRVGQHIAFANRDPVHHSVRCIPRSNTAFNLIVQMYSTVTSTPFKNEEVHFLMQCDVHAWEVAFASVVSHPFFAVTGPDGSFSFPEKLRPGVYTVAAWHEKFGEMEQRVVCLSPTKTVVFEFER